MAPKSKNPNIVQVEFFHTKIYTSPGEFADDLRERLEDGVRIKTTVRYYDTDGTITKFVKKISALEERELKVCSRSAEATGLHQWVLCEYLNWLSDKLQKKRTQKKGIAVSHLISTLRTNMQVVVEQLDHSFRSVRKDEKHELVESAEYATCVWFFIMEPNDLFAGVNKIVVSSM